MRIEKGHGAFRTGCEEEEHDGSDEDTPIIIAEADAVVHEMAVSHTVMQAPKRPSKRR